MDSDKLNAEMQYVERNGSCLNVDEKVRLSLAVKELKADLGLNKVWIIGKI
jgi:hypothetical protein